jgi:hypothetical protein
VGGHVILNGSHSQDLPILEYLLLPGYIIPKRQVEKIIVE